jgi:hypothetical protein
MVRGHQSYGFFVHHFDAVRVIGFDLPRHEHRLVGARR